ncbi:166_t:CDS:2, partial [Dentiscutata heterogama]
MAMVFTLLSFLKDSLTTFVIERQEQRKKAEEDRIRKEIEAENAKFQGTKVTVASFLEWKENFEREMTEKEKATKSLALLKKEEIRKNKLTGRQLFEQDEAFANSDATFIEEGDVTVDISLFEREVDIESEDEENSVLDLVRSSTDYFHNSDDGRLIKLQRMFTDMGLSKDLNDQFKERASGETDNGVDFSVLVLGTASWPLSPSNTNFIIPEE